MKSALFTIRLYVLPSWKEKKIMKTFQQLESLRAPNACNVLSFILLKHMVKA